MMKALYPGSPRPGEPPGGNRGEFLYPLIISGRSTRTVTILIQGFVTFEGINWGALSAAGLFITLPVLVFTFMVQKGLVRGLIGGAIK